MQRHWRAICGLFGFLAVAFIVALWAGSLAVAIGSLVSCLVLAFVMATAFMRPAGHTPEHHPKVDRLFDDTNP